MIFTFGPLSVHNRAFCCRRGSSGVYRRGRDACQGRRLSCCLCRRRRIPDCRREKNIYWIILYYSRSIWIPLSVKIVSFIFCKVYFTTTTLRNQIKMLMSSFLSALSCVGGLATLSSTLIFHVYAPLRRVLQGPLCRGEHALFFLFERKPI